MPSTIADFRRHALALPGAVESSHMGHPDFRRNDRIFATLSAQVKGCGVLKLTLDQQQSFISELPAVFEPVHGGWGRMGMTFIHLAEADDAILQGALTTAYRNIELRQQKAKPQKKSTPKKAAARKSPTKPTHRKP
jgi:YjbR protein